MDIGSYLLAKKYTDEALKGAGSLQGAPCQIKSIESVEGGTNVTFLWKNEGGKEQTSVLFVKNGEKGKDGIDGINGIDAPIPEIGENGHWWIGGVDTGKIAAPAIYEGGDSPAIKEIVGELDEVKNVTEEDNGKVMDIVDGKYVLVDIADSAIGQYVQDLVNGTLEEVEALLG